MQTIREKVGEVRCFGLSLILLKETDLHLICQWLNHPDIHPFLPEQRMVNYKVLLFWFRRISQENNFLYYMIYHEGEPIGFLGLSHIEYESRIYQEEYILKPEYIGRKFGYRACMCIELIAKKLNLETAYNYINERNLRSIAFVNKLDYELLGKNNGVYIYRSNNALRRKALRNIARSFDIEEEFTRHFGSDQI